MQALCGSDNGTRLDAPWSVFAGTASRVMARGTAVELAADECAARLNQGSIDAELQLCTTARFERDACRGDPGGSLTKNVAWAEEGDSAGGVMALLGVLSSDSEACANSSAPTVFTRVAAHTPWILDRLREGGGLF